MIIGSLELNGANTLAYYNIQKNDHVSLASNRVAAVPLPASAWLFGSALLGLGVIKRKKA